MGTAKFLIYMTLFVVVLGAVEPGWRPATSRFDDYPFIFLTLMLSLQASYAAPLILLAQNRQEAARPGGRRAGPRRRTPGRTPTWSSWPARSPRLRMALGEVATRDYLRSELRSLLRRSRSDGG